MSILGKISGKTVTDKIMEYNEVYGEVLLGLHQGLERQNSGLQRCQQQLATQAKQLQQLRLLCIVSYIFVFALGILVWLIH